ncbi:MAG: 30S ribosomal protein S24e [Thermoplasmata archaeon]|jgi:small subunit ribosomal protein S24e|nr:30S ribosomal protein S24e [Thermoplasmata archaeon]
MKMEIQEEKKNVLQERTEVRFVAVHEGECTPGRHAVAEELGKKYGVKRELVIIDALESQYGIGKTNGYAKIYDTVAAAKKYEPDYLLKRNGYKEEKAEEEAAE